MSNWIRIGLLLGFLLPIIPAFFVYYLNLKNKQKGVFVKDLHVRYYLGNFILIILLTLLMDEDIWGVFILIANAIFFISYALYFHANKNISAAHSNDLSQNAGDTFQQGEYAGEIPATCPSCKNPNTKRIRICEWCGGQIS